MSGTLCWECFMERHDKCEYLNCSCEFKDKHPKRVCRSCHNGECDECTDNSIPQSDLDSMVMVCECSCGDVLRFDRKQGTV